MRKSFRSPLTAMLREARAAVLQSRATGVPLDEVRAMRGERPTRRRVLAGAAATTAAAILPRRSFAIGQPRVAIVGAGIAGLCCAHRLWHDQRIQPQIYEWDTRTGGRIQTLRGYFQNGQITELAAMGITWMIFMTGVSTVFYLVAKRYGLTVQ